MRNTLQYPIRRAEVNHLLRRWYKYAEESGEIGSLDLMIIRKLMYMMGHIELWEKHFAWDEHFQSTESVREELRASLASEANTGCPTCTDYTCSKHNVCKACGYRCDEHGRMEPGGERGETMEWVPNDDE